MAKLQGKKEMRSLYKQNEMQKILPQESTEGGGITQYSQIYK